MVDFLLSFGFFLWPMLLVLAVILVLMVVNGIRLLRWRLHQQPDERVEAGINAILFWGVLTVVLGFLGQWTGLYKWATAISQATTIDPTKVAMGFSQSLQTSLLGLAILFLAALVWFALRSALCSLKESTQPES